MKKDKEMYEMLNDKISYLKDEINIALSYPLGSSKRKESAFSIAVILRNLVSDSKDCKSLIYISNYDNKLFFPFANDLQSLNLLSTYKLVMINSNKDEAIFETNTDLCDMNKVARVWQTKKSWLEESVVDFKSPECPPLSRERIIRLVADKRGAHTDIKENKYLDKVMNENVMPTTIIVDGKECVGNCKNLFVETIISIAKELVFSFEYSIKFNKKEIGMGKPKLYIQNYNYENWVAKKYFISYLKINNYNSNNYYSCSQDELVVRKYRIKFRDNYYQVIII